MYMYIPVKESNPKHVDYCKKHSVGPVGVEQLSEIAEYSSDECLSILTGLEPITQGVPIALVDKTN